MITDLSQLSGERITFWSRGNAPTQQAFNISDAEVILHFKALYLLSDRVIAAASFYFESDTTRRVAREMRHLLNGSDLLFFVNEEVENFTEHGMQKVKKSPEGMDAYADKEQVRELGAQLDSTSSILHRPDVDISGQIIDLWANDLTSDKLGTLGEIVSRLESSSATTGAWQTLFAMVAENRDGDFVWEYVAPFLRAADCPAWAMRATRRRLIQLYTEATARTLSVRLDAPDYSAYAKLTASSEFDTGLFLHCLDALRLVAQLQECSPDDLSILKRSVGWRVFHSFYVDLVRLAARSRRDMYDLTPVIQRLESSIIANPPSAMITRGQFIEAFTAMLQVVRRRRSDRGYRKLADRFLSIIEAFGDGAFHMFEEALDSICNRNIISNEPTACLRESKNMSLRSFIVHGLDRQLLLELKDYIQNHLGWPEPTVLIQQPNLGLTVIEKFEKYASSIDIVFVLISPEDLGEGGRSVRARQNVVFELGFFVGKFGRASGRVVLLGRGELEIPSDLHGVTYVDISNGVVAAGEHIRREVSALRPA